MTSARPGPRHPRRGQRLVHRRIRQGRDRTLSTGGSERVRDHHSPRRIRLIGLQILAGTRSPHQRRRSGPTRTGPRTKTTPPPTTPAPTPAPHPGHGNPQRRSATTPDGPRRSRPRTRHRGQGSPATPTPGLGRERRRVPGLHIRTRFLTPRGCHQPVQTSSGCCAAAPTRCSADAGHPRRAPRRSWSPHTRPPSATPTPGTPRPGPPSPRSPRTPPKNAPGNHSPAAVTNGPATPNAPRPATLRTQKHPSPTQQPHTQTGHHGRIGIRQQRHLNELGHNHSPPQNKNAKQNH